MQLIQSKEIKLNNLWEPELFGVFASCNGTVCFCFLNQQILYMHMYDEISPQPVLIRSKECMVPLPYHWSLIETPSSPFLLLDESLGISLKDKKWISPLSDDLLAEYQKRRFSEKHFVEDEFFFGDYCISHKGMSGYTCTKHGKHLWNFQGKAYLYTEIEQYQDRIFFGTAGFGGYFYILDLESGKCITKIKTGGTSCIERIGNRCYLLQDGRKTSALCVDLHSGEIIESIILPGKVSELSRVQVIDNTLHAVTFQYRRDNLLSAIWNAVKF